MNKKFCCLSGSTLKIIAIIAMFLDHFAASILFYGVLAPAAPISEGTELWTVYQIYEVLRTIGRIAFPIFCFLLVEGFVHTSNRKKYAFRLLLFACLSEVPFDLAVFNTWFTLEHQNVFFTLFLGFLTIWAMEYFQPQKESLRMPIQFMILVIGSLAALLLATDYDYKGIVLIVVLYLLRSQPVLRTVCACICLLWEPAACFAFIPIHMYNGKRGLSLKYVFYFFYPVHLLIFGLILQWMQIH